MRSACVASRDERGTCVSGASVWECTSAISPCTYMVDVWMQRLHYEKASPAIWICSSCSQYADLAGADAAATLGSQVCLAPMVETGTRLTSRSGLSVEVTARGAIRRFDCGNTSLNLFVGNELEGGPTNLY